MQLGRVGPDGVRSTATGGKAPGAKAEVEV